MATVVILIAAGFVLLAAETVLPGLIAGLLGFVCLISAVVTSYSSLGVNAGHLTLIVVLIGLSIGTIAYFYLFPKTRMGRALVSHSTAGDLGAERPELLDQTGVAYTHLRPSGTALIDGKRIDVISEGNLIERGTSIKVIKVEGSRVIVRTINCQ